jgi:hypothetical protein
MTEREKSNNRQGKSPMPSVSTKSGRSEALVNLVAEAAMAVEVDQGRLEEIKTLYMDLSREEKPAFFSQLLERVEVPRNEVVELAAEVESASEESEAWHRLLIKMRSRLESPRWRLFRHFIRLPGGLPFLLGFRADVLQVQHQEAVDLSALDDDLVRLFESWFQPGFMFLHEITMDSPYRQIEIIMNGDMVHPMTSLEEMGQRLGKDRRCFALYHRAMPEEPIIFIEVALTGGMVHSIHDIIGKDAQNRNDQTKKDTAVFYSINNAQNGLTGLGLGKMLVFQVVDFLKVEAPEIRNFCTLSPLPGFWRRYLRPILAGEATNFRMTRSGLPRFFDKRAKGLLEKQYAKQGGREGAAFDEILLEVFSKRDWAKNELLRNSLVKPLERLGYFYLAEEKNRDGRPLDQVAGFHLSNGATFSQANVHFGANWSLMGIERSLSLMVNYLYSQHWWGQLTQSVSRWGGWLPGLPLSWSARRRTDNGLDWSGWVEGENREV